MGLIKLGIAFEPSASNLSSQSEKCVHPKHEDASDHTRAPAEEIGVELPSGGVYVVKKAGEDGVERFLIIPVVPPDVETEDATVEPSGREAPYQLLANPRTQRRGFEARHIEALALLVKVAGHGREGFAGSYEIGQIRQWEMLGYPYDDGVRQIQQHWAKGSLPFHRFTACRLILSSRADSRWRNFE